MNNDSDRWIKFRSHALRAFLFVFEILRQPLGRVNNVLPQRRSLNVFRLSPHAKIELDVVFILFSSAVLLSSHLSYTVAKGAVYRSAPTLCHHPAVHNSWLLCSFFHVITRIESRNVPVRYQLDFYATAPAVNRLISLRHQEDKKYHRTHSNNDPGGTVCATN